jgi:ribonuclease D
MNILRELVIWRNTAARNHDVPPRAFLKDEILVDMTRTPVLSVDRLTRVRGLPRPIEQTHGNEIIQAIARAAALPPAQAPAQRGVEDTATEKFRADGLWTLTECLCLGRGIDPNLVANRQEIGQLHRHLTGHQAEVDVRLLTGWRRQAIGELLLEMVRKQKRVSIAWEQDALKAAPDATP